MADPTAAFKLMPGFDFLQGLVKNAGAAIPSVGQWVAPTLNPEEIEKRIDELRTVQFWLEQNARMLGATIQALEVQRMTLSTLKTMNLSFSDLTESLKIRLPETPEAAAPAAPAPAPKAAAPDKSEKAERAAKAPEVPPGVVDPMQLWGALTKQFTELATNAMKDTASQAAKNLAGAMAKQGFDAAGETLKKAAAMPATMAKSAVDAAQKAASAAQSAAGMSPAPAGQATARAGAKSSASRKRAPGASGAK
jgi:hypothetical protein